MAEKNFFIFFSNSLDILLIFLYVSINRSVSIGRNICTGVFNMSDILPCRETKFHRRASQGGQYGS